jgi:hypothetical protein
LPRKKPNNIAAGIMNPISEYRATETRGSRFFSLDEEDDESGSELGFTAI